MIQVPRRARILGELRWRGLARTRAGCENRRAGSGPPRTFMAAETHPDVAVEFRDVCYRLDHGATLLHGLNLAVRRGELLVLLGRSGSGKTTTLKLINRLLDPSSGQVLVEGRASTDWDPIQLRRHIGYAIQEVGLFPHFSVERNIGLVPALEGWPRERIQRRVEELLQLVGLEAGLAGRGSSPAANGSAWAWLGRSRPTRLSCSWTSPSAPWTRSPEPNCSASSWDCSGACARPPSSSPMICGRPCCWARASPCSKPDGWWPLIR